MRNRSESPLLLLGVAALGVAAGVLLDGEPGRRRRKAIAEGAAAAGESIYETGSGLAQRLGESVSRVGESVSSASHSVADGLSSATQAVSDRVTSTATGAKESLGETIESVLESLVSAKGSALAMAISLLRRRTRAEKLRDSISDGFQKVAPSSVSWKDVQKAVDNVRPTMTAPLLGGGVGLLLVGAGAYFLYFAPDAEERRRKLAEGIQGLISDVGEFAHAAGAQLSDREADVQPASDLADLVRNAISGVAGPGNDVHVTLRDGKIVLQGTANPEDYDSIVAAAGRVAPGFQNELQAVTV